MAAKLKYLRNYRLVVQTNTDATRVALADQRDDTAQRALEAASATSVVSIGPDANHPYTPFTVEFDIARKSLSTVSAALFRVYNLAPATRDSLTRNYFTLTNLQQIRFSAGYGPGTTDTEFPVIFLGYVTRCYSAREGTNIVTSIECQGNASTVIPQEGGYNYPAGTAQATILSSLMGNIPGVTPYAIGAGFRGSIARGFSASGTAADILASMTNGQFFIDNLKGFCLAPNEYVLPADGVVAQVNAASGLLSTPIKEQQSVTVTMLFEPSLNVGDGVELTSDVAPGLNSIYRVTSVSHRGTISLAVCGDAITTVEFLTLGNPLAVQPLAIQ